MRRVSRYAIGGLLACVLALGCTSTRESRDRGRLFPGLTQPGGSRDREEPFLGELSSNRDAPGTGTKFSRAPAGTDLAETFLAGRVLGPPGTVFSNVFIEVRSLEQVGQPDAKPRGVRTDDQGLFTIPARRGTTYVLNCRLQQGQSVLAGATVTQAPDARVRIVVSEDGVSSSTPKFVPQPAPLKAGTPAATSAPVPDPTPAAVSETPPPLNPPKVTPLPHHEQIGTYPHTGDQVPLSIQPEIFQPKPPGSPPPTPAGPPSPLPREGLKPAPVRETRDADFSKNFTLYDPSYLRTGRTFEFKDNAGKLVLLDFWGSWCAPCVRQLPEARRLAAEYGAEGLEFVGIACEKGEGFEDRADALVSAIPRIEKMVRRNDPDFTWNYRSYIERRPRDVQKLFNVSAFPTMILLSHTGEELWRSDRPGRQTLDAVIRRELGR